MKRVQNWRDYLEEKDAQWKQKIPKKKKFEKDDEEYTNKRIDKKRSKKK